MLSLTRTLAQGARTARGGFKVAISQQQAEAAAREYRAPLAKMWAWVAKKYAAAHPNRPKPSARAALDFIIFCLGADTGQSLHAETGKGGGAALALGGGGKQGVGKGGAGAGSCLCISFAAAGILDQVKAEHEKAEKAMGRARELSFWGGGTAGQRGAAALDELAAAARDALQMV
jgi:hypothetical protein